MGSCQVGLERSGPISPGSALANLHAQATLEAYAKLARLWATGTRQGGVGAATQQDAREQRRRLKASGAPLTQLLQETMDFFREVLKQTSRLMKAKRAGKLGDLEGFLNESLGLTEEAAHVAGVEQEVQRMNVDMATFSLGSKISESKAVGLVRLWQAVANVGEVFQYGKTKSPLHTDIEKAVETPKQPLSMSFYGGQSQLRVTGKNGHLDVMAANTDHPYINSIDADSAGDSGGGGSQLYQAALDWIHNNGKQIRDDPQGLSEINAVRRTSNFFASALRWGTTKHLKPHAHQEVQWSNTSDVKNIASLAAKEMDNAFKAIEQARKWRYDFTNERFINESGKELNEDNFREAVMVGDPATSGIGLSTLQRAVLTASAFEAHERGVLESIIHAGIDSGRVDWPLRGVTYSLSLSDRLEALSAALGEQAQTQPEQQSALLQRAREHLATAHATWAAQPTSTSAQQQALRSLDALLTVLPPEARAQLGGFLQLSSLSTAAARHTEIEKRFTQLTDYLAQPRATQAGDASPSDPLSLGTVIEKDPTLPGLLPSSGSAPSLIRPRSKSEYHSSKLQLPYMHETDSSESSHPRRDAQAALRELTARAENDAGRNARADAGERIRAESESLVSWARDGGWLVHGERFQELRKNLKSLEGGAEHHVHAHPLTGRVIKTTKAPNFGARGNLVDYLHNIAWSNELFQDDIVFEGVVEGPDGPSVIISQPFIQGTSPTEPQIIAWMEAQGYIKDGYNKWRHPDTGAVIADTHPGNFILDAEGYLVPIDLQVLNPGKSPRPPSS
ncbi:putative polyvalent protein kinase domain-containing protein [Prosthecobacter dejongeii]|uniref:Large polyvalent protein associated domain-containing protein n=1 Tax=Prosthecobacter dejongeii TaxID=48465 RepID=A0A7W7YQQ1_9BACT|nr:hypothetical protein [Prosthecobacter dejongeii]MBB5040585.1 hypothetical protein [Prosthecobacter dejongeii]